MILNCRSSPTISRYLIRHASRYLSKFKKAKKPTATTPPIQKSRFEIEVEKKQKLEECELIKSILENHPVKIEVTPEFFKGLYATRDIRFGETIFKEEPLVSGEDPDGLWKNVQEMSDAQSE